MKKIISYFLFFIFICFILPAILTNNKQITTASTSENIEENTNNFLDNESQNNSQEESDSQCDYEYKKYGSIKLLHTKTNEIEEIPLDEYLVNVVSAEMPASYSEEALKAQAIVARTYTVYKIENNKHERS